MFNKRIKAENHRLTTENKTLRLKNEEKYGKISQQQSAINILENKLINLQVKYDEALLIGAKHELTITTQNDEIKKLKERLKEKSNIYTTAMYNIKQIVYDASRQVNQKAITAFKNTTITIEVPCDSGARITDRKKLEPFNIANMINNSPEISGFYDVDVYNLNFEQIDNIKELGLYDLEVILNDCDDLLMTVKTWIVPQP